MRTLVFTLLIGVCTAFQAQAEKMKSFEETISKRAMALSAVGEPVAPEHTFELTVVPGHLRQQLVDIESDVIEGLVLHGKINGVDLAFLSGAEGRVAQLSYLDLVDVTFEYDLSEYRKVVQAPVGMGTTRIDHYYFSETNYDEKAGSTPTSVTTNRYRNDLSAAFRQHPKLQSLILPDILAETGIGESIVSGCGELAFLKLPEGVSKIGNRAFYYCNKIAGLEFPSTVTFVGDYAFAGTSGLGRVKFDQKVEKIGTAAFESSSARELVLPYPPDTIPEKAFSGISSLTIGEGLKCLGNNAFGSEVVSASLPQSLVEIGRGCFDYSPFVDAIVPEDGIRYIGKVAYEVADKGGEAYTVKEGTVSLRDGLFSDCVSAAHFSMPPSLEHIGEGAFRFTNIQAIPSMPGLKRIEAYAFSSCQNLGKVTIPESVEFIGDGVFAGCSGLWSITYCAIDAHCPQGVAQQDFDQIKVGDQVRRLPKGLYTGNKHVTEVVLPRSVEILDENAFANCVNLQRVALPDNVTTISDFAFNGCSALKDFHWPLHLQTIGFQSFRDCASLDLVSLPEGVTAIGYGAFQNCRGVRSVYVASTIEEMGSGAWSQFGVDQSFSLTCASAQPWEYSWGYAQTIEKIQVPGVSVDLYKNHPSWAKYASVIVPIGEVVAPTESVTTSFGSTIHEDTDLGDAVIGNVYVTVSEEDAYDAAEGCIVLHSVMTEEEAEAIGGLAPGKTDIANRFNGLIVKLAAGQGKIAVDCWTMGENVLQIKIGENPPASFATHGQETVEVAYQLAEPTYAYLYGVARGDIVRAASDGSIKIYAVGVDLSASDIDSVSKDGADGSAICRYYTVDGWAVEKPLVPGIYVVRRVNGQTSKILVP